MQYLSGVWESLTGQTSAKRKRSGDETEALPERMTSLKLFSDQRPGRLQSSAAYSHPPEQSPFDVNSCAAAESQFPAASSHCTVKDHYASGQSYCLQAQDPNFRLPPPPQFQRLQQTSRSNCAGSSYARYSEHTESTQPSFTGYPQQHTLAQASNSTQQAFSQGHQQHSFQTAAETSSSLEHSRSEYGDFDKQPAKYTQAQPYQPHSTAPFASAGLFCCETLEEEPSPQADCTASVVYGLPSPELDLSESVADSPDDNNIIEEITSSTSSPLPGVLMAFLALCQSPQVITALSKLQASHHLPCPTSFSALPLDIQQCPVAMSTELLTAGSVLQQWSSFCQLEWTLSGMFALCLRADLDPLDLDATMLLSLLWILESCSSQYNSNLTVVTSNYLAYTNVAAAAAGPNTPAEIRNWQLDMKTSQLDVLIRCQWRVHMDLDADLAPAMKQLQHDDAMPKLQNVLRHVEAESRHRRAMDAQLAAHRRQQSHVQHAQQAQQAQQAQHAMHVQAAQAQQAQQAYQLACCQSSTKPQKPRANMQNDQASHHARLRHEAEDLNQSSLNGKYWQTDNGNSQHDTLISIGHRSRSRAVRTKLSFYSANH